MKITKASAELACSRCVAEVNVKYAVFHREFTQQPDPFKAVEWYTSPAQVKRRLTVLKPLLEAREVLANLAKKPAKKTALSDIETAHNSPFIEPRGGGDRRRAMSMAAI